MITDHLPDKNWGVKNDGYSGSCIEACLVVFKTKTNLDFDLAKEQIGGEDVRTLLNEVMNWFESFNHWLWILTSQSLNPVYPDPKLIHRRSSNVITVASTANKISVPTILPKQITLVVGEKDQSSEYLVDNKVLETAIRSTPQSPKISHELLASARMAARRRDFRRALVDAGTATELVLSELLEIDENRKMTLGALITESKKRNINIPEDTQTALVERRNDAIHRGIVASYKETMRAVEIAEEILAYVICDLILLKDLTYVHRPQRLDLVFIQNKKNKTN